MNLFSSPSTKSLWTHVSYGLLHLNTDFQASKPPIKYHYRYPTLTRRVTVSSSRLGGVLVLFFDLYRSMHLPKVQIVHLNPKPGQVCVP
jgi:hypothetical protein